jgi:chaperone modulatory protein CbpM
MNESYIEINLTEICEIVEIPEQTLMVLVEQGIVSPSGERPADWTFDTAMVSIAKRAARLQRELELDWAAIAVVVELSEQRNQLQAENELLRQRLQRFLQDKVVDI